MATKNKLTTSATGDVRLIQNTALAAMEKALKPYGITVKALSGTRGATAKLRFEFIAGTGKAAKVKASTLAQYGNFHGLTVKDIGKTFVSNARMYRFDDIAPRRHKFPIVATEVKSGKVFKFTLSAVNRINPKLPAVNQFGY